MAPVLVGREREQGLLRTRLVEARGGFSSVIVLTGEPGIGKSALLADAREAAPGTVLSTVGLEGESGIAYVNLADIFRHHYAKLDTIPDRQAAALASIFAIGPSRPADRFTVSVATLNLLATIATAGPVLVTIDDAQWIDQASFDALVFASSRLEAEGVVIAFGVRAGTPVADQLRRFPTFTLDGLDAQAARSLLGTSGRPPMSAASASRLLEESGGNPLALLTLPGTMTTDSLALWALSDEPLPISSVLEAAFGGTVRELPKATRRALLLLAVMGSDASRHLSAVLAADGLSLDELDPAEDAGLLTYHHARPEFRHPLVRAAVYKTASSGRRRHAHRLAAQVLEGTSGATMLERRGWHLMAAGTAAEESLANAFVAAADEEFGAANFTVAGKLYERSSHLTPVPRLAMRRMLQGANALRLAGAIDESRCLLDDALRLDDDPALVARVYHAQHRLQVWRGEKMINGRDGLRQLGLRSVGHVPAIQAADIFADAALASIPIGDLPSARETSQEAMELVADGSSAPPLQIAAISAMVKALSGDGRAARRLIAHRGSEIDEVDPLGVDFSYQIILALSIAYAAMEDVDHAGRLLERAVDGARERSALGVLPFRLGSQARLQFWRGRWARARASAHEALRLAEDTGWDSERPGSLATLAVIEAVTGHPAECRALAKEAIAAGRAAGAQTYACWGLGALGLLELSLGNPAAAIAHLEEVAEFGDLMQFANSPVLWWSSDLIECYVSVDRREEARRELARLERAAADGSITTAAAVAARCHALLEPGAFERHMREALRLHEAADMPFEHARTRLSVGEYLRRHGQVLKARDFLTDALAVFDRLGAPDWANRARRELEAAGARVSHADEGLTALSPQELQVALAVARGLTNREVAAQLFLSVKTIEFHLRNVFLKLDINRRSQLAALVARLDSSAAAVSV